MHTIHKTTFPVTDQPVLRLPYGSTILSVGTQNDHDLVAWYLCDPDQPKVSYRLRVYGTGHRVSHGGGRWLGRVQTHNNELVWHIFQEGA